MTEFQEGIEKIIGVIRAFKESESTKDCFLDLAERYLQHDDERELTENQRVFEAYFIGAFDMLEYLEVAIKRYGEEDDAPTTGDIGPTQEES